MKTLLAILLATLCAATSYGQTVKSLGYNTTNGHVVYSGTNTMTFTNSVAVSDTEITSSGLSWASVPKINLEQTALVDENNTVVASWGTNGFSFAAPFVAEPTVYAQIRTNLGLGLPALTNTSNVTTMRALAGSTNTNQPFSGNVAILDFNDDVHNVTISNGIILDWQQP
jgi:hypothetical protein